MSVCLAIFLGSLFVASDAFLDWALVSSRWVLYWIGVFGAVGSLLGFGATLIWMMWSVRR
jgi:hypothetical protein